ncbi:hypothetical protein CLAIMM_14171 [Cladophialophora immunda]|nr:hypothetical protein CLAIMM_14171 [Cladophialophora immunda]
MNTNSRRAYLKVCQPATSLPLPRHEFAKPLPVVDSATHLKTLQFLIEHNSFPFLSSALFANWLRSSVVSVLFSLISEMSLR